jgi:hypothetical protein
MFYARQTLIKIESKTRLRVVVVVTAGGATSAAKLRVPFNTPTTVYFQFVVSTQKNVQ